MKNYMKNIVKNTTKNQTGNKLKYFTCFSIFYNNHSGSKIQ